MLMFCGTSPSLKRYSPEPILDPLVYRVTFVYAEFERKQLSGLRYVQINSVLSESHPALNRKGVQVKDLQT